MRPITPFRAFRFSVRLRTGLLALWMVIPAASQETNLSDLVDGSRIAIEAKDWQRALNLSSQAIDRFGQGDALANYGPQFGAIFYQKGISEMKLKRWQDAMDSFEICYRDFPNQQVFQGRPNTYEKLALLKWGEAAMGAEQWNLAIRLFAKFNAERDPDRDAFAAGSFHVNLAISHCMTGNLAQGSGHLEIAIRNKWNFPTPDDGIIAGFQALVRAAIRQNHEQVVLDFVGKNRGELILAPHLMHPYSAVFLKLAADASDAKMNRAALALYQFVPATDEVLDDLRAQIAALGPAATLTDGRRVLNKADLEAALTALETEQQTGQTAEMLKLAAIANLHESSGNRLAAFAAYQQLESYDPSAASREEYLIALVRLSTLTGRSADTIQYAEKFSTAFPDSPRLLEVRRQLISVHFSNHDYANCMRTAEPLLATLTSGTPAHEFCSYILGAAAYGAGLHNQADPWLNRYLATYPSGKWTLPIAYFQASNAVRLGAVDRAASLLDSFLAHYPDSAKNPYYAEALYDRATCHVAQKQPIAAHEKFNRILTEFTTSPVVDSAYLFRGRLERAVGNLEAAEKDCLSAFDFAVTSRDGATAGEALISLVELLAGDSRRAADALPHAERYWKEFANDSSLNHRMAIAQMSAFAAVGRADQGMEQLRTAIVAIAKAAKSEELLPLVGAYADAYLIHHDADQFATHVESICQLDPTNRMLQSSLQLAVIDTYEALAKSATDDRRQQAATAALKNRIQRFKREFAVKELSNRDLLRLGDFLYLRTASPKEAVSCYNEVISRGDARLRFPALLGRGDIGSRSRVPAEIQASLADFSTVYQDSLDRAERDYALFRMIGLLNGLGDHEKALEQALIYLNNSEGSYLDFIPEVEGLQAQSLASLERYDEAIAVYSRLWGLHRDHLTLSAPAMLHWMQLNWHHAPADRSATCEAASQYIEQTRPSKEMAPPAWGQITELLLSYRQTLADASATLSPSEE